jgi:hypothetical protein
MSQSGSTAEVQVQRWQQAAAQLTEARSNVLKHHIIGSINLMCQNIDVATTVSQLKVRSFTARAGKFGWEGYR